MYAEKLYAEFAKDTVLPNKVEQSCPFDEENFSVMYEFCGNNYIVLNNL